MAKLVSATYGDSLYEVAVEQNMVDRLFEEADSVLTAYHENPELAIFLNHPKIVKDEKIKVVRDIFGPFVSAEMTGFLATVVNKDRAGELEDILSYFIARIKEYKKIGVVYVETPQEMSDSSKEKLVNKLLATTAYESLEMHYSLDESLIGGMVIRIGDRIVDSSIRTKLQDLSRELYKL